MRFCYVVLLAVFTNSCYAQECTMLVGTYSGKGSKGIYSYKFNMQTGKADSLSVAESSNPSFLTVAPNKKFVYAVNENTDTTAYMYGGSVSAFALEAHTGKLTFINKQASEGKHPCYITISNNGAWVIAGSYTTGTVFTYKVAINGGITKAQQVVQHIGSSVNKQRQQSAHVHATILNKKNTVLYVPDLGMDSVKLYNFNNETGLLTPHMQIGVVSVGGSGPRHFCFDNKERYAYLIEELTGTIQVYKVHKKRGSLKPIQHVNPYTTDMNGIISSADIHIHPNGKFLYCSNRANVNTISIFSIANNGLLNYIQSQSTMGLTPRNFSIDPSGNFLLVANQNSNQIVVFKINKLTGLLENTNTNIQIPNPVNITWVQ
jgi:6-phosphogluconolactonase